MMRVNDIVENELKVVRTEGQQALCDASRKGEAKK